MHVRSSSISTVAGIIMYLDVDYEHDKGDHTFTKQVRYEIDGKEIRTN